MTRRNERRFAHGIKRVGLAHVAGIHLNAANATCALCGEPTVSDEDALCPGCTPAPVERADLQQTAEFLQRRGEQQ